jgi:hypothetical protein
MLHSVQAYSYDHLHFAARGGVREKDRTRYPHEPVLDAQGEQQFSRSYGMHAGEVHAAIPEAAGLDETDPIGVDYGRMTAILWAACQIMEQRISDLEGAHPA